jgi:hypothetical protein
MSSNSLPIPEFVFKKKKNLVAATDTHALPLTLHHQIGNSMHQKTPCVTQRYGTNNEHGQLPTEDKGSLAIKIGDCLSITILAH